MHDRGRFDVLIITAADGEDDAVREVVTGRVGDWNPPPSGVTVPFAVWRADFESAVAGVRRPLRVGLVRAPHMGVESAAMIAAAHGFDRETRPSCIAMCGVCAGRPGWTQLGDVIVAERVYRHDVGELVNDQVGGTPTFRPDIQSFPLNAAWVQHAQRLSVPADASWRAETPDWQVHVRPFATGSQLIRDVDVWQKLSAHQRLVYGFDMEASVIGQAGFLADLPWLVVKGIMDNGEPGRSNRRRAFAARAAAEVLLQLLRELIVPADPIAVARPLLSLGAVRPASSVNPSALLDARYAVVPFADDIRAAELRMLRAWCNNPDPTGARVFAGVGGSGKTRLFLEWCRRLRDEGWTAGFLPPDATEAHVEQILADGGDVLVVLDYAEVRPTLARTLELIATRPATSVGRVRVALLVRNIADWYDALRRRSATVAALLETHLPHVIQPITVEGATRTTLFMRAVEAFAEATGKSVDLPVPDLEQDCYGRVLYIEMAALAAVERLQVTAETVFNEIVRHERRYWATRYRAEHVTDDFLAAAFDSSAARCVAAVTLRGGVMMHDAAETLNQRVDGPRDAHWLRLLHVLHPAHERALVAPGYLSPLEPDLLGEKLIEEVLKDAETPADFVTRVFADADDRAIRHGFCILGRLGERVDRTRAKSWIAQLLDPDVPNRARPAFDAALTLGDEMAYAPLGDVLYDALQREGTLALARELGTIIETVSLSRVSLWCTEQRLAMIPDDKLTLEQVIEREHLLRSRAMQVSQLGQLEQALSDIEESVRLARWLVTIDRQVFLPTLVRALQQSGVLWSDGLLDEALVMSHEAVGYAREIAA